MIKKRIIQAILIIILIVSIVVGIFLITANNIKLTVEAPKVIFVDDLDTLRITSNKGTHITPKYGYITSDKSYYNEKNPTAIIKAIRNGKETITIESNNQIEKVEILVCDKIKLVNPTFDILVDEIQNLDLDLDQECLSYYNISIKNEEIATYQDGIITGKKVGTTTLTISNANESTNYTINVSDVPLEFDLTKTGFKTGDKYTFKLINKRKTHTCSTDSNLITLNTTDDGCSIEAISDGIATIKATDGIRTAEVSIRIEKAFVAVEKIVMKNAIHIKKGSTYNLKAQVLPGDATDKSITYTSNDTKIATVSNGTVKALKYGTTTIEAKTSNGKKATISIIVTGNTLIGSYESDTLNYWIDKRGTYYVVTNIWVKDAYSQFKTAITSPKNANSPTPRNPEAGDTIIKREIKNKNYQNKGLVAINASAMVSSYYGKKTPSSWYGTAQIPLILNDGKTIRNSSNEAIRTDDDYIIYGLKKNGDLTYYKYQKGFDAKQREENKNLFNKIINDGVLYTFGFKPVLLENGKNVAPHNSPNIRQAICQVDKNNFILITNTNSTNNRNVGFGFKDLAGVFQSLNCKTALNLDGGGSTCEFYKDNTNNLNKVPTTYGSRQLSDMIYFVEQ